MRVKIITLVSLIVLMFAVTVHSEEFAHYYGNTICVYEEPGTEFAGKTVNVLFCEKTNHENIAHIGSCAVDGDGTYFYKFEFTLPDGKSFENDYVILTKTADSETKTFNLSEKPDSVDMFKFSAVNDALYNTNVRIKNLFGSEKNQSEIIASRNDLSGRLISATVNNTLLDYGWRGKSGYLFVPNTVGADAISVFAWNNMKPLADKISVANEYFEKLDDGDVVAIAGDSIVHLSTITPFMEHFYQTRYPEKNIRIINTGIGGDTVGGLINRLDWDICGENPNKIFINCGINDLSYTLYSESDSGITGYKKVCFDNSLNNYGTILDTITALGIEPTVLGTNLYDEYTDYDGATGTIYTGVQSALEQQADEVKEITAEKNVDFYNINKMLKETTELARKSSAEIPVVNGSDRIHLSNEGGVIYAALVLMHQGNDEKIAETKIDVNGGTEKSYNADVTVKSFSADGVEYEYAPASLPLAVNDWYKKADELIPLTEYLNKEEIKVTGLGEGTYNIIFTDESGNEYNLGSFTDDELTAGINIAVNENNPSQIVSKKAMEQQNARYWYDRNTLRTNISKYRSSEEFKTADTAARKAYVAEMKATSKSYSDAAKSLSVPERYSVRIEKAE